MVLALGRCWPLVVLIDQPRILRGVVVAVSPGQRPTQDVFVPVESFAMLRRQTRTIVSLHVGNLVGGETIA
jgi:hypothetical protein